MITEEDFVLYYIKHCLADTNIDSTDSKGRMCEMPLKDLIALQDQVKALQEQLS